MAIVVEKVEGSQNLIKTYSDAGLMIQQKQTGAIYEEAIDVDSTGYTYIETDTPIEEEEEDTELSDTEALNILLGRENNEQA